jgi:CHAT domain-containing protein
MFVPVHAAGTKDESCSDYFVSSYTPTLSALVEARRNPRRIMREELRVLLAATKDAYRLPTLWSVHEEISIIKSILPPSAAIDITEDNNEDPTQEDGAMLNERETEEERIGKIKHVKPMKDGRIHARERHGINSTMDDVLAHIPHADIVHLACHGTQDDDDPLASGFQLAGGSMTFRDLMRLKLEKPLLAYLGACDTAKGHDYLAEEAFHLCSAMLFMGFKSVVGTMW